MQQRRLKSRLPAPGANWTERPPHGLRANSIAARAERDLEERICAGVASGQIRPGDALPPERELAKTLTISRGALRQALANLESRGLIQREQGRGNFISTKTAASGKQCANDTIGDPPIRSVGMLLPSPGSEFFCELRPAFERRFRSVFDVPVHVRNAPPVQQDLTAEIVDCVANGIDAFAIAPRTYPEASDSVYRMLRRFGIPFVSLIGELSDLTAPAVRVGSEQVADMFAEQLLALGHHHAGVFAMHGNHNIQRFISRLDQQLSAEGGRCPEGSCAFGTRHYDQPSRWRYATASEELPLVDRDVKELADELRRVLDSDDPPSVLFAGSNALAEEIYMLLLDQGVRVPQDVCLVGYGSTPSLIGLNRQLATITIDTVQMGESAADLLIDLIRGERPLDDPHTTRVQCSLEAGFSLAEYSVPVSGLHK